MKLDLLLRCGLAVYYVAGYVSTYYYTKRSLMAVESQRRRSSLARTGLWLIVILMPISAAFALFDSQDAPIFALLIGATMNICWFYAGCLGLLRGSLRL